uniref:Uncharacterized protein n=1 Tax=Arundo donax TaxID=35708 RepID=A0A0A9EYR7_ARUDO
MPDLFLVSITNQETTLNLQSKNRPMRKTYNTITG